VENGIGDIDRMVKVIMTDKKIPVWDIVAEQYGLLNTVTSPTIDKPPTKTIFKTTYNPHPCHDAIPPVGYHDVRVLEKRFGLTNFLGYVTHNKIYGLGSSFSESSSVSSGEDFKTEG
jgi:hypothetical protein